MTQPAIDVVHANPAVVGEGAIWSQQDDCLYWCDIPAGKLHRFDPAGVRTTHWQFDEPLGCVAQYADGAINLALSSGFHRFEPASGALTKINGPDVNPLGHRFNDGSVDAGGRFYAGHMPLAGGSAEDARGTIYHGDRAVLSGFHIVNGMAFSNDGKTAYVSDSFAPIQTIWAYDYDPNDGAWGNKRPFFDCRAVRGRPDGGAIDSDGCYWFAGVSGWQLVRLTPNGVVDRIIDFPCEKPSRIAFGGSDLKTLYVTTIGDGLADDVAQPNAGCLFALQVPGVQGVPFPNVVDLE